SPLRDGLLFFDPSGPDSRWRFDDAADHDSKPLPAVDGPYQPVIGHFREPDSNSDSVYWYRPGAGADLLWFFSGSGNVVVDDSPPQVTGTYDTAVGDYDGNGVQDIAWEANGQASIWLFSAVDDGAISQTTASTGIVPTTIAFGHTDPADL
ncbi:MAG TPA: hypothetical protein VF228_11570, partial [Iamia sp.]